MALNPNFDTRDDCSKRVHRSGAERVQAIASNEDRVNQPARQESDAAPIPGVVSSMRRAQLLHAEVAVHPHRVQMHPVSVHLGDFD